MPITHLISISTGCKATIKAAHTLLKKKGAFLWIQSVWSLNLEAIFTPSMPPESVVLNSPTMQYPIKQDLSTRMTPKKHALAAACVQKQIQTKLRAVNQCTPLRANQKNVENPCYTPQLVYEEIVAHSQQVDVRNDFPLRPSPLHLFLLSLYQFCNHSTLHLDLLFSVQLRELKVSLCCCCRVAWRCREVFVSEVLTSPRHAGLSVSTGNSVCNFWDLGNCFSELVPVVFRRNASPWL